MSALFRSCAALFAGSLTLLFSFSTLSLRAQTTTKQTRTPVLVELFTSEGCSSCPPADALLMKLDQEQPVDGAEIIVLGEHVDYWDQLGWHDRFSSRQYTQRQNEYGSRFHLQGVYTPQMVVDGAEEFVGNDSSRARRAIVHAAQSAKIPLALSNPVIDGHRLTAAISLAVPAKALPNATLYAALIDPTATTNVRNGENGGRQLHHVGVVRSIQRLGNLEQLSAAPLTFRLDTPADAITGEERVVVFAQREGQGMVLAAVSSNSKP